MATTIAAGTVTTGAVITSDTAGSLQLQSGSTPTTALTLDSSQNATFAGTVTSTSASDSIGNLRSIPLNSQTSAYILAASDNGKMVSITTGGVTVNNSIMSAGMVVTIYKIGRAHV